MVLPLAVPDLPLILWCRSARVFAMPEFDAMAAMADKVIIDSAAVPGDAARGPGAPDARRPAAGCLAIWPGRVSRAGARCSRRCSRIAKSSRCARRVARHGGFPGRRAATRPASFMGAWVMDCLAAAGAKPDLTLARGKWTGSEPAPLVMRVVLEGEGIFVELMRWDRSHGDYRQRPGAMHQSAAGRPIMRWCARNWELCGATRFLKRRWRPPFGVAYPNQ